MNQQELFSKAKELASAGEDFSIIVGKLEPEYQLRLKWYVRNLPDSIQEATIYGRAHSLSPPKQKIKRFAIKRGDL
jgi:hypothetical protein